MAEIVGTVSAALTFIDFVFRVTKTAKTVRASDNGLDEYDRLRTFAESLKDGVKSLENDTRKLRPLPGPGDLDGSLAEAADRTVQVSKACLSVADEIITLIDKVTGSIEEPDAGGTSTPSASGKFVNKMKGLLGSSNAKRIHRAKSPTPNSNDIPIDGLAKKVRKKLGISWQGTKVALAVMWNERELEGLRKEFQSCTEMLAFHWNTVFRYITHRQDHHFLVSILTCYPQSQDYQYVGQTIESTRRCPRECKMESEWACQSFSRAQKHAGEIRDSGEGYRGAYGEAAKGL